MLKRKRESDQEKENQETTAKFIVDCIYDDNIQQPLILSSCTIPIWLFKMITKLSPIHIRKYLLPETLFHLLLEAERAERVEDVLKHMKHLEDLSRDTISISLRLLGFIEWYSNPRKCLDDYATDTKVELNNIIFHALCTSNTPGYVNLNDELTKDGLLQLLESYTTTTTNCGVTKECPLSLIKPGTTDVKFVQKLIHYYDCTRMKMCIRDYLSLVVPEQESLLEIPFRDVDSDSSARQSKRPCMECAQQLLESKHHSHVFYTMWHGEYKGSFASWLFNNNSNLESFLLKCPDSSLVEECQDLFIERLSEERGALEIYFDSEKRHELEERNIGSFELLFNGSLLQLKHCARILYDPRILIKASKSVSLHRNFFYRTYGFIKKIRYSVLDRCSKRELMLLLKYAPVQVRSEIMDMVLPKIIDTSGSLILATIREYHGGNYDVDEDDYEEDEDDYEVDEDDLL